MSPSCRVSLLVSCLAALACSDTTNPTPTLTKRLYQLVSVDGHAVPTVVFSGPIETYTVLDGTLTLFSNDSSEETEHANDSLPQYGVSTYYHTWFGQYRIEGDSIATGFFGRCRDICIPNRIGVLDDSTVTLTYQEYPPDLPVYRYRLLADQ